MQPSDQVLLPLLLQRSETAFETVFKRYFKDLHSYACAIVKSEVQAEEMVQQVFYKLWERTDRVQVMGTLASYLYRAVHNECLNHLKHLKVRQVHQEYTSAQFSDHSHATDYIQVEELEQRISNALLKLPEQCRIIFQMSRFEELKYKDIADKLGLSVKTIENQMGKALRIMRMELADYLPAVLLYLFQILNNQQ